MVEKSILQSRSYTRVSNVTQKQSNEIYSATRTKEQSLEGLVQHCNRMLMLGQAYEDGIEEMTKAWQFMRVSVIAWRAE